MEIKINKNLKKIDSELIKHLISISDEKENTIVVNRKYLDVFKIIKKNKTIYINFKNVNRVNHIIEGLAYFGNKKIFEDILKKLAKYIKEKYIDRKSVERFFISHQDQITAVNNFYLCGNSNLSEEFFKEKRKIGMAFSNTNLSEEQKQSIINILDKARDNKTKGGRKRPNRKRITNKNKK